MPLRAGLVVDDDRLLRLLGERLADGARELVGGAAGRERHDERDRLRGEALRRARATERRGQGSGRATAE